MRTGLGWVWWLFVQVIMGFFEAIGWFLLIPFCLVHAWPSCKTCCLRESINTDNHRGVDYWLWEPLNWVYGNPEDGVSGQQALVWVNGVLSPYMPMPVWMPGWRWVSYLWACWRAYCWSAWRNSADNLKYVFAWKNGPRAEIHGKKIGWWPENGFNVPVW